jgi:uncharacterized protein
LSKGAGSRFNEERGSDVRRIKKKITDQKIIIDLLETAPVGRLGTVGADGWPVIKPLNFVFDGWRIYFHSATEGEKIEDIRRDGRVCFEVDLPVAYVQGTPENPCAATFLYRSVIARGRAEVVQGEEERLFALSALMRKYQPESGYGEFVPEKLALTAVIRIEVEEVSGKEDLGSPETQEKLLGLIAGGATLPVKLPKK